MHFGRRGEVFTTPPEARGRRSSAGKLSSSRPLQIQREQPCEDVIITEISRPTIGREYGSIEFAMGVVRPGGSLVVQLRQRARTALRFAQLHQLPRRVGDGLLQRDLVTKDLGGFDR